jgi:hypothetical protein
MASDSSKLVESVVDDDNGYGYKISWRQFQSLNYERWKLVQFVGQKVLSIYMNCTPKFGS